MMNDAIIFVVAIIVASIITFYIEHLRKKFRGRLLMTGAIIVLAILLLFMLSRLSHKSQGTQDDAAKLVVNMSDISTDENAQTEIIEKVIWPTSTKIDTQELAPEPDIPEKSPVDQVSDPSVEAKDPLPAVAEAPDPEMTDLAGEITSFLNDWSKAWENAAGPQGEMKRFGAFYDDDFQSGGSGRTAWLSAKTTINKRKSWIKVELSDIEVGDLQQKNMVEVSFLQDYSSSNYSQVIMKVFTLRKGTEGWKIIAIKR